MQGEKTTPKTNPIPMPAPSPKTSPNTGKVVDAKQHKAKHLEREIPPTQVDGRAEVLPSTHIDDDPESYRLT